MSDEERLEGSAVSEESGEINPDMYPENGDTYAEKDENAVSSDESDGEDDKVPEQTDYARLAEEDMRTLIALFPALRGKHSVAELDNPIRYAALRDLGLTPKEAYLATAEPVRRADNRSHLTSAVPHGAGGITSAMSARELDAARELFSGLSDREIRKLYNKVTK